MESPIFFSVIITCFNRERTIIRSIESVLSQTHQNYEIIVVDDGSTDNSVEIINTLANPIINLICHSENKGQNTALNTGLASARYDHVAFLDSDDIWMPDFLELMNERFLKSPDLDFVYGYVEGWTLSKISGKNKYAEVLHQGFLSSMITLAIKRKFLLEVGGFDKKYSICQDDDICMRMAKNGYFDLIERPIALVIGDTNRMTLDRKKLADGWRFFFMNYKKDIIRYCGMGTWGKHLIKISEMYFIADKPINSLKHGLIGNILVFIYKNNFGPEKYYNIKILKKSIRKLIDNHPLTPLSILKKIFS
jgi:glycosyltransferase involved in cell wall biosynthesis